MDKTKVKVISTTIGRYDYDSITVKLDNAITEICFNKTENVTQYQGKEIYLSQENGKFIISPVETKKIG